MNPHSSHRYQDKPRRSRHPVDPGGCLHYRKYVQELVLECSVGHLPAFSIEIGNFLRAKKGANLVLNKSQYIFLHECSNELLTFLPLLVETA
jgi:hypothetical protein